MNKHRRLNYLFFSLTPYERLMLLMRYEKIDDNMAQQIPLNFFKDGLESIISSGIGRDVLDDLEDGLVYIQQSIS